MMKVRECIETIVLKNLQFSELVRFFFATEFARLRKLHREHKETALLHRNETNFSEVYTSF